MKRSALLEPHDLEWGAFGPLRLRARGVAEGVWAGTHRSVRKGAGVEFAGQRPYVHGDDLRYLDRRALLRHDRLFVREFETETDSALWLVLDATASMRFVGHGPGSKLAFGALVLAALARTALTSRDPVGLVVFGTIEPVVLPSSARSDAFDRIVDRLEAPPPSVEGALAEGRMSQALAVVRERARRGSRIVLASDFVDLPPDAAAAIAGLGTKGRRVHALSVLSPDEATLPFEDSAHFRASEGDLRVEADPVAARDRYLAKLAELRGTWRAALAARGGSLLHTTTDRDPVEVVRAIVRQLSGSMGDEGRSEGATWD